MRERRCSSLAGVRWQSLVSPSRQPSAGTPRRHGGLEERENVGGVYHLTRRDHVTAGPQCRDRGEVLELLPQRRRRVALEAADNLMGRDRGRGVDDQVDAVGLDLYPPQPHSQLLSFLLQELAQTARCRANQDRAVAHRRPHKVIDQPPDGTVGRSMDDAHA